MPSNEQTMNLEASEIAKGITVTLKIKGYRGWVIRLLIAKILMRLAVWIAGMNYEEE